VPVPDYRAALADASLKGVRIGVPKEYFGDGIDAEVAAKVRDAIARCEAAGAVVKEVSLPHTKYAFSIYQICATAEASANLARFDGVRYGLRRGAPEGGLKEMYERTRTEGFGYGVKRRVIFGTFVLSSGNYDKYYVRALKARTLVRKDFEAAFAECDVIATPTCATVAYEFDKKWDDPIKAYLDDIYAIPSNLAGNCAISVPCGVNSEGLPVGLQFIGPNFGEVAILKAARAFEEL